MKRIFSYFICALAIFLVSSQKVEAGSVGLYASSTSVTVGNTVIVTVKANNVAGPFSITSNNPSVLSGGTSNTWIEGTVTFSFYAANSGSATIRLVPVGEAGDFDTNQPYTQSHSVTIYVNPKRVVKLSSNNNLESLSIDGTTLSPEFSNDVLEYTAMLEAGTSKIHISATSSHEGATITGIGDIDVVEGDNDLEVSVTAEDGSTRTFKIKVTVKEYNPVTVKMGDKKYIVVRNKNNLNPPDNYEASIIKMGEEEVPVYIGKITKYTLISLKDEKGKQNWYVKDGDNYTLYNEYKFGSTILYVMELAKKDIPANFKKTTITYHKKDIVAYKENKKSDYALLYGMNVETGKTNIYMYDAKEGTVQIYNKAYFNKVNKENGLYLKITLAVSIVLLISIGIIIYLLVKKKSH